jgi:periplasmic copper chaperone A
MSFRTRYKAVLRVPHGCAGSPTVAIRVQLPHGITTARPMPNPGWEVEIVREPLAEPISDGHGGQMTERVAEIHWTGGSPPDAFYDEFVFRTRLPDTPGATIQFPVVQESRRREPLDRGARRRAGRGRPAKSAPALVLTN